MVTKNNTVVLAFTDAQRIYTYLRTRTAVHQERSIRVCARYGQGKDCDLFTTHLYVSQIVRTYLAIRHEWQFASERIIQTARHATTRSALLLPERCTSSRSVVSSRLTLPRLALSRVP